MSLSLQLTHSSSTTKQTIEGNRFLFWRAFCVYTGPFRIKLHGRYWGLPRVDVRKAYGQNSSPSSPSSRLLFLCYPTERCRTLGTSESLHPSVDHVWYRIFQPLWRTHTPTKHKHNLAVGCCCRSMVQLIRVRLRHNRENSQVCAVLNRGMDHIKQTLSSRAHP